MKSTPVGRQKYVPEFSIFLLQYYLWDCPLFIGWNARLLVLHSSHSLWLGVHKSTPIAMTQIVLYTKVEERKQQCVDGWTQNELLNTIYRNSFFRLFPKGILSFQILGLGSYADEGDFLLLGWGACSHDHLIGLHFSHSTLILKSTSSKIRTTWALSERLLEFYACSNPLGHYGGLFATLFLNI